MTSVALVLALVQLLVCAFVVVLCFAILYPGWWLRLRGRYSIVRRFGFGRPSSVLFALLGRERLSGMFAKLLASHKS